MRLETERLVIRDWQLEDADAAFLIYGDPEVMRYVGTGQAHESIGQTRKSLARIIERDTDQPLGFWAVDEKLSGKLVGGALLKPLPDDTDIEVGYHLGRTWWGRGIATEATIALLQYGFESLALSRIVGVTYPQNMASRHVLEKAGLVQTGSSMYLDIPVESFVIERNTWLQANRSELGEI